MIRRREIIYGVAGGNIRVIATVDVSHFTTRDTPTIALKKLKLTDKRLRSTLRRYLQRWRCLKS